MSKHSVNDRPARAGSAELPIDKLVEVISRSQHNYRELIDNLDQAVFTLSLQGEILVANRRLSEFIGHPFSDFVESPTLAETKEAFARCMSGGSWQGTVPVCLKRDKSLRHF